MVKKSQEGLTVKKEENFSEWYSQVIEKAEVIDLRYGVKGFVVIRPWGAMIIENMYDFYEKELQKKDHKPSFFPLVIPEKNFKKESSHIKGFSPEVFWLNEVKGEDKLALRPTSETAFYQMFSIWIRSWRDLPLKLYQRANIFRYETKATRPLIRAREFYWIETHDCFETKEQAEKQVQEDITTTEEIMHQKFLIPFLAMKRPSWDTFPGAEYSVAADSIMPTGKLIQQPSTHLIKQSFIKAFDIKFKDKEGKEKYVWTTCYGPAPSRMLASVISTHGDNKGLIIPFGISPIHVIIIPIFDKKNKNKILKESEKIKEELFDLGIKTEIDSTEKRPGEKYYEWELKGVPFRIEIGEKEIKNKKLTLFIRDLGKKQEIKINELSKIKKLGEEFDKRLKEKADNFMKNKIVNCKTKQDIKKAMECKKIARINFCSINEEGKKCAEHIEKKLKAEVRGVLANKKEKPSGKCILCNKQAKEVVYIGKSY
jgi:prolyl-tRNA synthetase|tara:strand:+ start:200 stop:1651 length:1452 start_codon:yes stop_codon:yes gene_type:complete